VKKTILSLTAAAFSVASTAFAQAAAPPTKVGVINIQAALVSTRDGQKAAKELDAKRAPRQKELEAKQNAINQLRDQLNKGSNTMSQDARDKLVRDIDQRTKSLNRDMEDAQAEMESEQQKVLNDLGAKIMTVIDKYARDNAYALILDISSPQTPVLFATNQIDVTQDIVRLYDEQSPASNVSPANPVVSAPAPASPAPKPVGLTPAAPARKK